MAPMRCRSPTNFMRWLHRSVQFEAPQFLSWKIPSSDQQRDTTHLSMRSHSASSTRNLLLARPTNIVTLFAALPLSLLSITHRHIQIGTRHNPFEHAESLRKQYQILAISASNKYCDFVCCPAAESFEHYSPTYSGSSAQGNAVLLSSRLSPHAIPYPSWCHIIAVAEPLLAFF